MAWVQEWEIPFDKLPYKFNLECLADWQKGSKSCCQWKIDQHIDDILEDAKTTDSGVIFAGDIEDEDRPSTRAMRKVIAADRSEMVDRDAEKHVSYLESDVLPLLKRLHEGTKFGIMGGVAGHHWTFLPGGVEVKGRRCYSSVEYMFARLEEMTGKPCVYLGEMVAFLDLRFRYTKYKEKAYAKDHNHGLRVVGLLQHGEGGGQTKGATIGKLERAAQGFDADFYIRGHDCQLVGTKTDQLFARSARKGDPSINCRTKAMLNLGSATMGYEMRKGSPSYIEQAMMRPATMGWGKIKFRVRRGVRAEDPYSNNRIDMKLEF